MRAVKQNVFANQYDQVELSCDVKSNPQSIIAWFFKSKELLNSYKYNISNMVRRQINRTHMDEPDNMHSYRSTLTVKSITQFDYGDYYCRANNIMGGNGQMVHIKKKRKLNFFFISINSGLAWNKCSEGQKISIKGSLIFFFIKDYLLFK